MPGAAVSSPSGAVSISSFRPIFSDFGPPSMGFIQGVKPAVSQAVSQGTYSDLLSVIEEMGREIRPTYAGSKSAMERLKRGIIHARALVRECLAETERNAQKSEGKRLKEHPTQSMLRFAKTQYKHH